MPQVIVDFHIHSKFARATSKDSDLEHFELWCKLKGIDICSVADFTHPVWFAELRHKLEETSSGMYSLKKNVQRLRPQDVIGGRLPHDKEVRFIFATEISSIYKKNGRARRIHTVIVAPSMEVAGKINVRLDTVGNLKHDGRPILGLDVRNLAELCLEIDERCLIIPAHIWTPWFAMFGSKSGFDSIEECFEDMTPHIYAVETGLSSDPSMNWRVGNLDNVMLVSNSDAHSPQNLGREANVFEIERFEYAEIRDILKNKRKEKFPYTIEFFPEEGKYHMDGHAPCKVALTSEATKKNGGLCPSCKKSITVGVMSRVDVLSTRKAGEKSPWANPYKCIIPLHEMIAECVGKNKKSKTVVSQYFQILRNVGPEFFVLIDANLEDISRLIDGDIAKAIENMRTGKVSVKAGYDGIYGTISALAREKKKMMQGNFL